MNKHKFIRYVSDETRIRVNECDYMVNAILRCIKDVLATGEDALYGCAILQKGTL